MLTDLVKDSVQLNQSHSHITILSTVSQHIHLTLQYIIDDTVSSMSIYTIPPVTPALLRDSKNDCETIWK